MSHLRSTGCMRLNRRDTPHKSYYGHGGANMIKKVSGLVLAAVVLSGCIVPPPEADTPPPTIPGIDEEQPSGSPTPAAKKPAPGIPGDGTFEVPGDVKPGTYKSAPDGPMCYWARLKGTGGEFGDIIANGNAQGPVTVTIKKTDKAFETSGCKTWRKVR